MTPTHNTLTDEQKFNSLGVAKNWSVTVEVNGQSILCISNQHYAGESDLSPYKATITGCAEHLLAFIGAERAALSASAVDRNAVLKKSDVDYPRDVFCELISGNSPYAFYLFQWVPYQTDANRWRLKMCHDVRTFDGREAYGIWPNGSSCGPFKDDEVEFIRISRTQHGGEYKDPRALKDAAPKEDKRKFRGVGELERTGYIPEGSAAEREAQPQGSERERFEAWAEVEYRNAEKYTARDYQMGLEGWQARALLQSAAPAMPTHRTDEQIVQQTEELAAALAKMDGYALTSGTFREGKNSRQRNYWERACIAQQMLTSTDPEDAVIELEDAAPAQTVAKAEVDQSDTKDYFPLGTPSRHAPLPDGWLDDYITCCAKLRNHEMPGVYFVQGVRFAEKHFGISSLSVSAQEPKWSAEEIKAAYLKAADARVQKWADTPDMHEMYKADAMSGLGMLTDALNDLVSAAKQEGEQ